MVATMTERQDRMPHIPPVLEVKDAAALLGVSVRTLDRYQAAGIIAPIPVPRMPRRFKVSDLAKLRGGDA